MRTCKFVSHPWRNKTLTHWRNFLFTAMWRAEHRFLLTMLIFMPWVSNMSITAGWFLSFRHGRNQILKGNDEKKKKKISTSLPISSVVQCSITFRILSFRSCSDWQQESDQFQLSLVTRYVQTRFSIVD